MKDTIITKFSSWFVTNYRITVILIGVVLAVGALVYTTFLPRDGFPPIQFPISIINATYFVDNSTKVDNQVGKPIYALLDDFGEVVTYESNADENFLSIRVQFEEGVDVEDITAQIEDEISSLNLPNSANVSITPVIIDKFQNKYDILLAYSAPLGFTKLQPQAIDFAKKLTEASDEIELAEVDKLITKQINPFDGRKFDFQEDFIRSAQNESGELKFSNSILLGVVKSDPDQSAIEFSHSVDEAISLVFEQDDKDKFKDVSILTVGDIAETLEDDIASLESNALSALIVVTVILLVFVNWRSAIIGAIFIPLVMASTFIGMYVLGVSLNLISLFALILVLGLFVDDAIVIIEAIDYERKKGKKDLDAIKSAINNVGLADVLGTLTTLLVFAPLLAVGGILGEFTKTIPVTVILALTSSLVLALAVIPFLSRVILLPKNSAEGDLISKALSFTTKIMDKIAELAARFVWLYSKPTITLGSKFKIRPGVIIATIVAFGLIGVGGMVAGSLDFSVFPPPKDSNQIAISVEFTKDDLTLKQAQNLAKQVEKVVVENISEQVKEVTYDRGNLNGLRMIVDLTDMMERDIEAREIQQVLEDEINQIKNIEALVQIAGPGGPAASEFQVTINVFGNDIKKMRTAVNQLDKFMKEYDYPEGIEFIESERSGFDSIVKKDGDRFVSYRAKVSDSADTAEVLAIQDAIAAEFDSEKLEELGLESDAFSEDLGTEGDFIGSLEQLIFASILSLVLMYVLLVALYKSFLQPVLIIMAIPLCFPLLFPGLAWTDNSLGFLVTLGITGLIGIVVNNSILLVDYANQLQAKGLPAPQAITKAVQVRFRPLLTTSVTTVVGILPLALTDPFWEGLGFTIIFGLISSTILVILLFPAFYIVVESVRGLKGRLAL